MAKNKMHRKKTLNKARQKQQAARKSEAFKRERQMRRLQDKRVDDMLDGCNDIGRWDDDGGSSYGQAES